jgi:CDP-diacylglycerol---serine O-phosphatidyltransferase
MIMAFDNRKLAFFLPNTFTALNMACGYAAILLAMKGNFYLACIFIVLAAVFDSMDGRVARMTGTQSSFGEQFDSLSDLISFGVAPAFLYYFRFLQDTGRPGMILAFLFMLCGALRLARFNANIDRVKSDYFQGLPIPGGACAVTGLVLLSVKYPEIVELTPVTMVYLLFYSLLMISSIPFQSFKNSQWVKNHKKQVLMIILAALASILMNEEVMILSWISLYVLGSLAYVAFNKEKFAGIFDWKDEPEQEV